MMLGARISFFSASTNILPEPITKPFCLTALEANSTFQIVKKNDSAISLVFETSPTGERGTWTTFTYGDIRTLQNVGDKLYIRTISNRKTLVTMFSYYNYFVMTGKISASGNINSLLNYNFDTLTITYSNYTFSLLFENCKSLVEFHYLPQTTLAESCYRSMFNGCSSLTTAPELPATTLAASCYLSMFNGCSSLTQAPALKAMTLTASCYMMMFRNCTSLTIVPELSATSLANNSLGQMFYGCSNLDYLKVHFTTWTGTSNWLLGVKSTGTLVCPSSLPDLRGNTYIPTGWTKVDL